MQAQLHAARRIEQRLLQRDRHGPQAREHLAAAQNLAALLLVLAAGLRQRRAEHERAAAPAAFRGDVDERRERVRQRARRAASRGVASARQSSLTRATKLARAARGAADARIRPKRARIALLGNQHGAARRPPRLEIAMRLRRIAQRVGLVDLDLDAPALRRASNSSAAAASSAPRSRMKS